MTPQSTAEWQAQPDALAQLKREFEKTWPNTVFSLEVGGRAALPADGGGSTS